MKVIKEMPPDLDNKGEITEVQVLEEGEVFGVDAFLASIPKPGMTQPQCPRCLTEMTFGCILNQDGLLPLSRNPIWNSAMSRAAKKA